MSGRLLVGIGCLLLPAAALAEECSRSDGVLKYCPCLYIKTNIKQKLDAAQKALERCFKKSDAELEEEMGKIK